MSDLFAAAMPEAEIQGHLVMIPTNGRAYCD